MSNFQNPILSGFHPDPSLCRVGEDFYLVTSSFEYGPGLPIVQSRDLIHWRQIGHVLERSSQLPLPNVAPSGGIYAPTLRFHDGTFYVITTNVTHGGNFVVTATDPAGPWSDPFWIADAEGIDPSLFFDDDGRCYYTGNGNPAHSLYEGHHTVWMQEFDIQKMRLVGEKRILVDGGSDIAQEPIWIEGPHLYKINGWYILLAAEGGTGEDHSVVVFRSPHVAGPYESYPGNPILTNRYLDAERPSPITSTGHGDLCQTPGGDWWMVLLACRPYPPGNEGFYNMGRETFLVPMIWQDGWPITRDGTGNLLSSYPRPNLPEHRWANEYGNGGFSLRDEFAETKLRTYWNFLGATEAPWASLTARPGFLRLELRPQELAQRGTPSFVGQRLRHAAFAATTLLEFQPADSSEAAGLVVIQNNAAFYSLAVSLQDGVRFLRLLKKSAADTHLEVRATVPIGSGPLRLKIEGLDHDYGFSYAEENGPWRVLRDGEDGRILSTKSAGGFVGAYLGLYAITRGPVSGNHADFERFEYIGYVKGSDAHD